MPSVPDVLFMPSVWGQLLLACFQFTFVIAVSHESTFLLT